LPLSSWQVVAIMIEKKQAVDNLEALLSVPTVDMVQFGPSDYSMSIGKTGQRNHPKVCRLVGEYVTGCPIPLKGGG
jgi:2-keto-3-deoxy-L-rhamnonate aldolase RhmA